MKLIMIEDGVSADLMIHTKTREQLAAQLLYALSTPNARVHEVTHYYPYFVDIGWEGKHGSRYGIFYPSDLVDEIDTIIANTKRRVAA